MNEESMSTSLVALERAELTLNSDAGPVDILRGIDLAVDAGETLG
jgi:predicted ABC-type transport system involved in lysophospholipase L1 biosynthesis ATPase subunit